MEYVRQTTSWKTGRKGRKMRRKIVAVGHRGTILDGPENSIHSHNRAFDMGARGIEFDIQTTSDGVFVLFHDDDLEHKSTGNGPLRNKTRGDLQEIRLRKKIDGDITNHSIPTLKEALTNVEGRFMVDLDFKRGPDNSEGILRDVLMATGFDRNDAPLVTIFCRNSEDFDKVKGLNDICSVRPLYDDKEHVQEMSESDVRIMGLRNHQYKSKTVRFILRHEMQIFVNSMNRLKKKEAETRSAIFGAIAAAIINLFDKTPEKIYKKATKDGALFIQTDDMPGLVKFLKSKNLYQDKALNRNLDPIDPFPPVLMVALDNDDVNIM